ncbi:hypothetical protein RB195_011013 [Necator americanus]|uniref:Uncharacterized protein n=1 Tax=Necator americanus TaxID=51031 RepID=A0ABR1D0L0_NECAM
MAISTYNARTLASEAAIEDLMILTETRRRHPLNAVYETGEELFLGTCDSRGVGGVGVLVNTSIAKNIDSLEQLTTRIGRLRMKRCGPTPALTIFVAYPPTSSYEEEEVEAFYMDLENSTPKLAQEERRRNFTSGPTAYNGTTKWRGSPILYGIGPSPPSRKIFLHKKSRESRQVQREESQGYHELGSLCYASRLLGRFRNGQHREEYDRLVGHLHDCAKKAESFKTTKRRLPLEILELICQHGAARAAENQELTSKLARLCRKAIKENLKERRAEVLAGAAEAGKTSAMPVETLPVARRG